MRVKSGRASLLGRANWLLTPHLTIESLPITYLLHLVWASGSCMHKFTTSPLASCTTDSTPKTLTRHCSARLWSSPSFFGFALRLAGGCSAAAPRSGSGSGCCGLR
eukprot:scaffold6001_cov36-Phaeocystis_antarctica.AAC.1